MNNYTRNHICDVCDVSVCVGMTLVRWRHMCVYGFPCDSCQLKKKFNTLWIVYYREIHEISNSSWHTHHWFLIVALFWKFRVHIRLLSMRSVTLPRLVQPSGFVDTSNVCTLPEFGVHLLLFSRGCSVRGRWRPSCFKSWSGQSWINSRKAPRTSSRSL